MSNEKTSGCLGYIGDEILPRHRMKSNKMGYKVYKLSRYPGMNQSGF